MRYRRYFPQDVIDLTREAIHAFTIRDMERFVLFLDRDFSFIADDEPIFLQGIPAFLENTRRESQSIPVELSQEEYTLLAHERHLWVTFGRFHASCPPMTATIHFTFVWRQKGDDMLLLHANAAHARPVAPAGVVVTPDMEIAQAHMFDQSPAPPPQPAGGKTYPKRGYRDLDGHIRYLTDGEIVYCQSRGKICEIHSTTQPPFSVRTSLHTLQQPGFFLIHRSYVVNLSYVKQICRYLVTLENGTELPIGQEKYLPLKRALGGGR